MTMTERYNIAKALADMAASAPYQPGVVFPAGRDASGSGKTTQVSYLQLNSECDRYAHGLSDLGIAMGDHVLLLVRPGAELIAVVFALCKMGAVPVLIDPGMGRKAFLQCVSEVEPTAFIGIPSAHLLRRIMPGAFRTVKHTIIAGGPSFLADTTLSKVRSENPAFFPIAPTTTQSKAAIAFTSGSTGVPKGVVYQHGMFQAQIKLLRDAIGIEPGEVDLALLYVFALFNPALGVTTIFPDMDPTKSAEINPAYVVESVQVHGVTNAFGSPTIWKRVAPYCAENNIHLPSLKRVIMAGAPVPPDLISAMYEHVLAPDAKVITPYGATEAMPLTLIDGHEILEQTAELTENGKGMCVGTALPGITLKVIKATESAIPTWDESLVLKAGDIGEIVVKGPMVTRVYLNRPRQTALAKIADGDAVWHRMGDVGYFDNQGRLWFCGRKKHRVFASEGILYPVQCETIFNRHPDVFCSAVVGVGAPGDQRPILVVECIGNRHPTSLLDQQRLIVELLALGAEYSHTRPIQDILFYVGSLPTDVRHNVKIQREKLAVWAAEQLHILQPKGGIQKQQQPRESTVSYTGKRNRSVLPAVLGSLSLVLGIVASVLLLRKRRKSSAETPTPTEP